MTRLFSRIARWRCRRFHRHISTLLGVGRLTYYRCWECGRIVWTDIDTHQRPRLTQPGGGIAKWGKA